jgi:hypothetical protein
VVLASRRGFESLVGRAPRAWRARLRFLKRAESIDLESALRDARLVVSKSYLRPEIHRPILAARRAGVPTLLLVDGPLEWSNLYAHPRLAATDHGLYDPVVHDAVAAIGDPQRRWIEGRNAGRGIAFVTYANRRIRTEPPRWRVPAEPPYDFLVATARTPFRDEAERRRLEQGLHDLGLALAHAGRRVLVRVPQAGLRAVLRRVLPTARFAMRSSFARALFRARCVIGTPSSVLLESMYHDRPTALLRVGEGPLYYGAGWLLDDGADRAATFESMLARDEARMAAQRTAVRTQLSRDDFFDVCEALLAGGRLRAARPLDARDEAFETAAAAHR